eukprot:IDg9515t1
MSETYEQSKTPIICDFGMASSANLSSTVVPPHFERTDVESIRLLLHRYDTYRNYGKTRAQSFGLKELKCLPVALKYCIDLEYIYASIELGLLVTDVNDSLEYSNLRAYLEPKAVESTDNTSIELLDELVRKELMMDMSDTNAMVRMQKFFILYHTILRRYGLKWLPKSNAKVSVKPFLTLSVSPKRRNSSTSALRLIDKIKSPMDVLTSAKGWNPCCWFGIFAHHTRATNFSLPPQQSRRICHLVIDCKVCPEDEKKPLLAQWFADHKYQPLRRLLSCTISLIEGDTSKTITGRCDDRSEDSIVSPRISESTAIESIGRIARIHAVELSVAMKMKEYKPQWFRFSRENGDA